MPKYIAPKGVQAKPKLNPNLKMRQMTDVEVIHAKDAEKYTNRNGKPTFLGSARLLKDVALKSLRNLTTFDSYKKGGKVKKTGLALLHKGEMVIPKKKFIKEHKHLVKVLKTKKGLKKEAKKQSKELKKYKK